MPSDNDPMMNEKAPQLLPSGVNWALPLVTKVQGIALQPAGSPGLSEVVVQYASSQTQRWCELRVPLDQALFLASLLDQLRKDPQVLSVLRKNP
jgi:hypothetical protein